MWRLPAEPNPWRYSYQQLYRHRGGKDEEEQQDSRSCITGTDLLHRQVLVGVAWKRENPFVGVSDHVIL